MITTQRKTIEKFPHLDLLIRKALNKLGKPFNGQYFRRLLFEELLRVLEFDTIIETGTNRGSTTSYFAEKFSGPIYTFEFAKHYAQFSRLRLSKYGNITLKHQSSLDGLKELFESGQLKGKVAFFYLDAHWDEYLPLFDEIKLILEYAVETTSLIMVDDFAVPGDAGYSFDSYAAGTLNYAYIKDALTSESEIYFPSTPSECETGYCRGCIIITSDKFLSARISDIETLTQFL